MSVESSGCYVIDSEYNVVNVNETAHKLYPQLEKGKKCYKCLMNIDEPCGPCPVFHNRKGPKTYIDPIRNISEIVDAVDINIPEYGPCHMLIFSTVENDAAFAASLPTSADQLKDLALIKALTNDYYDVLTIHIPTDNMLLYRLKGKALSVDSIFKQRNAYKTEMALYIQKYVHEDDQEMMTLQCSTDYMVEKLKTQESYDIHYRVILNGELHYYYRKIVRIGNEDDFENVVIGIGCEDEEVKRREKQMALQHTLHKVETSLNTGLLTKEAFIIYGDQLLKENKDTSFDFCILRIENLEGLKRQYGAATRDRIIQNVGKVLKQYESNENCISYFGDGNYGCFAKSFDEEERKQLIEEANKQIHKISKIRNISLKWYYYRNVNKDMSTNDIINIMNHAIIKFRSKFDGDYTEFDNHILEQINWDLTAEKSFTDSLKNGEFVSYYQPKYSVDTQKIVGAEALVRWITPNGQMVPPDKFIPVLENSGLINLLDEEIYRQTCDFEKELESMGITDLPISVNLSRASMFINDIATNYSLIADRYGIKHELIPIEITESAAVRASMIGEFTNALIQNGFVLHMDDFGSGYSSLASLQTIPFDTIKLDKSLVDFIGVKSGESLLKHTISFAKESGMNIVAEGVESYEQFMFLKVAGCDAIQGYYFSKPVDKVTFVQMLKEN